MMRKTPFLCWMVMAAMLCGTCAIPVDAWAQEAKKAVSTNKPAAKPATKTVKTVSTKNKRKTIANSAPRKKVFSAHKRPAAEQNVQDRFAALVVNAETGQILYEVNANEQRYPASLTKMMTLYLLFDAMKKGKVNLDTMFPVSAKAAAAPPTNISLTPSDRITVRTAIQSLIIRSANDVAMVVAEALGGSQEGFAEMMNKKARQLGMTGTKFYNPSGLPDMRQVTTAYDMARIGIALRRDFPEYYKHFSVTEFSFHGRQYEGHNRLLGRYPGADGIKTGFIGASGFNLVTSVKRGSVRLVGVILGGRTAASRDRQMMDMLDNTFASLARGGTNVSDQHEETRKGNEG